MTLAINGSEVTVAPPQPGVPIAPEVTHVVDTTPADTMAAPQISEEDPGPKVWDAAAAAEVARGIVMATAAERAGRRRLANQVRGNGLDLAARRANHALRDIEWDEKDQNPQS
jgi:hypothetical protein